MAHLIIYKCTSSDAGHAVGEGDGGQATASRVFARYFISTICTLNGRKVAMWILGRMKQIKKI